jgi:radical SAM protein with 4Fe4S-binding SPASM domain
MFSVTNILCGHAAGNESLRYGHRQRDRTPGGQGAPGAPRPVVVWAVTRACNLRCQHCYAAATPGPGADELTGDEGRDLLAQLADYEVPAVLFSGGEPLARPDTLDLMRHARGLGLRCTLSTNGLLIDDAVAGALVDMGVTYVGISLDGLPATHDRLRGQRGAFDGTLEAIRRCRRHGLRVGVRFTVHGLNRAEMGPLIQLCDREGIDRLCVYHLAYAGRGERMASVDLTAQQTREVVDELFDRTRALHDAGSSLEVLTVSNHADAAYAVLRLEREGRDQDAAAAMRRLGRTGGNRSGQNICSISPAGGVHYDQFSWHYRVGSIREQRFADIWADPTDERLKALRARPAGLPGRCQSCRLANVCNGNLRTRAESATGDWLGADPACYLTDDEVA